MKIAITAVVTCVATLALTGAVLLVRAHAARTDTSTPVRIESPAVGDLVEIVSAPGTIEPRSKVSISAKVSALIIELPRREGQRVRKGDVLVRLDDKNLQANLKSAQSRRDSQAAQIEVAKARLSTQEAAIKSIQTGLADARRSLEREKALLAAHVASQENLDQAQCQVDKLDADLTGAQHTLKADQLNLVVMQYTLDSIEADVTQARDLLNDTVISSPFDGVVTRVQAEVGEMAITGTMNNPGTEILQVADLSAMLLVAELDETYVGQVEPGQPARVRIQAYRDQVFEGTVESIALVQSLSQTRSKYYETKILLDTRGQSIRSGLTADVDIETRRHHGVLKVPSQAVLGRRTDDLPLAVREQNPNVQAAKSETPVVYRMREGRSVVTPVKIGPVDATHTAIVSGLTAEDRVIVGPYKALEQLKHDQAVRDERTSTSAPATAPASQPASAPGSQPANAPHGHANDSVTMPPASRPASQP